MVYTTDVTTRPRLSSTSAERRPAGQRETPDSGTAQVLRRAGLLSAERRGRYVHYSVDLPALTALGTDLLAAVLR
jgi:hypothetical protein